jgi:hypothetical protein
MVDVRIAEASTDSILQKLQSVGVDAYRKVDGEVRIRLLAVDLDKNGQQIEDALRLGVEEGGGL